LAIKSCRTRQKAEFGGGGGGAYETNQRRDGTVTNKAAGSLYHASLGPRFAGDE